MGVFGNVDLDFVLWGIAGLVFGLAVAFLVVGYLVKPAIHNWEGAVSLGRELFGSFRADCSIRGVRSDWESIRR